MNPRGEFSWSINRGPWRRQSNLITDEGRDYLIDNTIVAATLATPGEPFIYLALFGGNVTPVATWTAATFAAAATENTSTTEGPLEATRVLWTPAASGNNVATNYATPAEFNIRSASNVTIYGFGCIVGEDTRGGVAGDALLAAVRFSDAPVVFDDHDIVDVRWTITLA